MKGAIVRTYDNAQNGKYEMEPENMRAAVALLFAHYNFVRVHQTIRCTPAMEAGVVGQLWTMDDLLGIAEGFSG